MLPDNIRANIKVSEGKKNYKFEQREVFAEVSEAIQSFLFLQALVWT